MTPVAAGREPQYAVTFPPLASRLMDECSAVAGEARFSDAQVLYDVLYNASPDLMDFPFDKRRKRPGRSVRRRLTTAPARGSAPTGACFIGKPAKPGPAAREPRAIDCLREDFLLAKDGFAADFLGRSFIRRAARAVDAALESGSFAGPVASKRVAVVLAAGLFDR